MSPGSGRSAGCGGADDAAEGPQTQPLWLVARY